MRDRENIAVFTVSIFFIGATFILIVSILIKTELPYFTSCNLFKFRSFTQTEKNDAQLNNVTLSGIFHCIFC